MSKQLRVYREGAKTEFDYQILWEEDFTKLADAVKKLELSCGKICIVADDTVGNLYGKEVQKALEELDVTVDLYTFPAGEASKNLDTVYKKRCTGSTWRRRYRRSYRICCCHLFAWY